MASSLERPAPLAPVLSDRYALGWKHVVVCGVCAVLFLLLSHAPLGVNGPWRNLRLGSMGFAEAAFCIDDPAVPLSAGMDQPHLGWLSSVVISSMHSLFGIEGAIQTMAIAMFVAYLLWARCFFRLTGNKLLTVFAVVLLFVATNGYFSGSAPATFSFLFAAWMSLVLCGVVNRHRPREGDASSAQPFSEIGSPGVWWQIPLIMVLWVNFSASFLIGLLMLLGVVIGNAADAMSREGARFWRCHRFQQSLYLLELGFLVTCIHPLGMKVWANVIRTQQNPFWLAGGGRWHADFVGIVGAELLVGACLTLLVFRFSKLKILTSDIVVIATLLIVAVFNVRLFAWLTPFFQLFFLPHLARRKQVAAQTKVPVSTDPEYRPMQFAGSLVCLLFIWMAFALSPISTPLLGGNPRPAERTFGIDVPADVTAFLSTNPQEGLVWAPSYWSDWIGWNTDASTKLFAASNVATLPSQVQRDYERVFLGDSTWDRTLSRYAVKTLVIDKNEQDRLFNMVLREGQNWAIVFESETAIVLRRQETSHDA